MPTTLPPALSHEMSSPAQTLDHGFEPRFRHGCLSAFLLFVLSYVGSGLATRLITRPRSPTDRL
jgi:hypothetical protein